MDTAFRLFYARGPRGVGVDTIIDEAGVAKASFYKHFPRKDDLVLAYLDEVDRTWLGQLRACARAAGDHPAEQLVGMFDALHSAARREGYHGCAFINSAAEASPGSEVHARSVDHKRLVRAWVTDLARRAGAADPEDSHGSSPSSSTVGCPRACSTPTPRSPRVPGRRPRFWSPRPVRLHARRHRSRGTLSAVRRRRIATVVPDCHR